MEIAKLENKMKKIVYVHTKLYATRNMENIYNLKKEI